MQVGKGLNLCNTGGRSIRQTDILYVHALTRKPNDMLGLTDQSIGRAHRGANVVPNTESDEVVQWCRIVEEKLVERIEVLPLTPMFNVSFHDSPDLRICEA